jgi:hypothetical protein
MKAPKELKKDDWDGKNRSLQSFLSINRFPSKGKTGRSPSLLSWAGQDRPLRATAVIDRLAVRVNGLRIRLRRRRAAAEPFAEVASGAAGQDRQNR